MFILVNEIFSLLIRLYSWICILFIKFLRIFPTGSNAIKYDYIVVNLDQTLGDNYLLIPFIKNLHNAGLDPKILLLASSINADLWRNCPYINHVKVVDYNNYGIAIFLRIFYIFISFLKLRKISAKVLFVPRFNEDHLAPYIAGLLNCEKSFVFSEESSARKKIFNYKIDMIFTDPVFIKENNKSYVNRSFELIRAANIKIDLSLNKYHWNTKPKSYLNKKILLGISHGNSILKNWGIDNFSALIKELCKRGFCVILAGHGYSDAKTSEILSAENPQVINLVNKINIHEIEQLTSQLFCYVGNDTGLAHLCASFNVPTFMIFGSSCPHIYGANYNNVYSISSCVDCSPCSSGHLFDRCTKCTSDQFMKCMTSISVDNVLSLILKILK